jgi:multidrug efflux pump subunit AcrA (membrane-fusion protein)
MKPPTPHLPPTETPPAPTGAQGLSLDDYQRDQTPWSPSNGSPSPAPTRLPRAKRKKKRARLFVLLALALVLPVAAGATWYVVRGRSLQRTDNLVTHTVAYEKLALTIVERGSLESAENRDVTCQVKAGSKGATGVATTIKWVIDDGTPVKRGQLLAELDDSGLWDSLKTEEITLDTAKANWISAEEAYKIVESQNNSDIKTAEIAVKLAELDLVKYLEGDYLQSVKDIDGRTSIAESDLEMRRDRSAWAQNMVKKGYLTTSQAQAEQSLLQSAQIALAKVKEERRVLEDYTKKRTVTDLESKVAEAKRALERVKAQALSKDIQAKTDRDTKRLIYEKELDKKREIEDEIKKCTVTAPQDGLVVYFIPEQVRGGQGSQQSIVAQGEPVREGQKMMRIPDLTKMQVNTRVHEAMMSRVRGEEYVRTGFSDSVKAALLTGPDALTRLSSEQAFAFLLHEHFKEEERRKVYPGQAATIKVDAHPGKVYKGHVRFVATVASQQDWMSADVRVYQTLVTIDQAVEELKPGMSAEVTISTGKELDHVLVVPKQAIFGSVVMGNHRKCFILTPNGPEEREVEVGLSNERMAEIKSGLAEGDEVVLNPQTILNERIREKAPAGAGKAKTADGPGEGKGAGRRGADGAPEGGADGKAGNRRGGRAGGKGAGGRPPADADGKPD